MMPRISTLLCVLALVPLKALLAIASSTCPNGAGGTYSCTDDMKPQTHALTACESVYGVDECMQGSCGDFEYYLSGSLGGADPGCNAGSRPPLLTYEFVYENDGHAEVGEDYLDFYGPPPADKSWGSAYVKGNSLFVRQYTLSGIEGTGKSNPEWLLALENLGENPTPSGGGEGTCFGEKSTLSVQSQASGPALSKALPDVKTGDKVLTVDHRGNFKYDKVVAMRHSKSKAPFIEIAMENPGENTATDAAKHHLLATEHHTFPLCSSPNKEATAMSLKPGDCLQTTDGHRLIASVGKLPLNASEETYTVVVGGDSELIVVGGVVTHALSFAKALKRLRGTAQKNKANADIASIVDRYEKSQA